MSQTWEQKRKWFLSLGTKKFRKPAQLLLNLVDNFIDPDGDYLSCEIVFDSGRNRLTDAENYVEPVGPFAFVYSERRVFVCGFPWPKKGFRLKSKDRNQLHCKQTEEKKSTLRCAPSLLFSHGEKTRHHAKRRCARWISSLQSVYTHNDAGSIHIFIKLRIECKICIILKPVIESRIHNLDQKPPELQYQHGQKWPTDFSIQKLSCEIYSVNRSQF